MEADCSLWTRREKKIGSRLKIHAHCFSSLKVRQFTVLMFCLDMGVKQRSIASFRTGPSLYFSSLFALNNTVMFCVQPKSEDY